MAEVLWALFFVGVGLLWVVLVYAGLSSYGSRREDQFWPVWKVLLCGDRESEEAARSRSSECRSGEEGG